MLSLERDGWAGADLEVDAGGAGTDTWDFDTRFGGVPEASHYSVITDIVDWGNDAARPWSGSLTLSWSQASDTGRWTLTLAATSSVDWSPSTELQDLMRWAAGPTTSTSIASAGGLTGTWSPSEWRFAGWEQWNQGIGVVSRSGGFAAGHGNLSPRRPEVKAVATDVEVLALTEAFKVATSPRRGHFYHLSDDAWRFAAMGKLGRVSERRGLFRVTMGVLGGSI